jgi:hypothetical protein
LQTRQRRAKKDYFGSTGASQLAPIWQLTSQLDPPSGLRRAKIEPPPGRHLDKSDTATVS